MEEFNESSDEANHNLTQEAYIQMRKMHVDLMSVGFKSNEALTIMLDLITRNSGK